MIEFKNVCKTYKTKKGVETRALNNINIKIGNVGLVFITGKSGSGKSTMLNLLGGLDTVTSGSVLVNNRDITKFKSKQYDSYRNTYIGFIFQEFNILEDLNVYENINLALRLQNKKVNSEKISDLLEKLDIKGLEQRKVNELSGGQKQRVAIARALIKNPKIILADEPTGNLDKKTSKQIFDLLKEISKEKLVIVVSHDIEAANTYADRIIELSDGNIIKDTKPDIQTKEEPFNLTKSKLPFSYSLKMAIKSLNIKPLKLFMTCILTAMALIFMGFTINCLVFDKETFITNTMKDNHKNVYIIQKTKYFGQHDFKTLDLNNKDLNKIKKETNSTLNKAYSLLDNEIPLSFTYGEDLNSNTPDYFNGANYIFHYVELEDNKLPGKIIGHLPNDDRQLVIHKFLAEYIIKYGVIDINNELYKPKNIQELVNSNHKLKLGDNAVTISGVVDDNNSKFKKYKNGIDFNNYKLRDYYTNFYSNLGSTVYVKGFTKTVKLNTDKELILHKMSLTPILDNSEMSSTEYHQNMLKNIKSDIQIITNEGLKSLSTLNKSEVILSLNDLKYYDKTFSDNLDNYLKQNVNTTYGQAVQNYTIEYLKETNNLQKLKLKLRSTYSKDIPVTVLGITMDDYTYISNEFVEEYNPVTKSISSVYIRDDNVDNLKRIFKDYKYSGISNFPNGTYYTYELFGMNQNDIESVIGTYKALYKYILVISLIFVLFAILLFSNFIGTSISYAKKEIGILKALGARNKDTLKIFTIESIIIGIISWIISVIGWSYICDLLNNSMFGNMYYSLNGIIKSPLVPIGMFIFTIIIALVITFISTSRVNKIKPIDAILNK